MAARAKKRVDAMKGAVVRSTPKYREESDQSFGDRIKEKYANALEKMKSNESLFYYGTSKYKPHQGAKECARRVKQGINGTCYIHGQQYGVWL